MSRITRWDSWTRRAFIMMFTLIVALNLLIQLLEAMNDAIHRVNPLILLIMIVAISGVAYFVRDHRRGRPRREATTRGAGRTPILPDGEN